MLFQNVIWNVQLNIMLLIQNDLSSHYLFYGKQLFKISYKLANKLAINFFKDFPIHNMILLCVWHLSVIHTSVYDLKEWF